jgi:hypothetical protein
MKQSNLFIHIEGHETELAFEGVGYFVSEAGSETIHQLPLVEFKNSLRARL